MDEKLRDSNTIIPYTELLEKHEIEHLNERMNVVVYRPKDIIFKQNTRTSHIMFIKEGLVKIYKEERIERNHILNIAKPGDYIGLMTIFGNELYQYSAAAINQTEICFIDIEHFRNLISTNGKYALQLINTISNKGLFIIDKLINQVYKQLPGRIASVLLYFSEHIYHSNSFNFPLTRKELAELAGTTKESFIRTLTEFKNDKIITIDGSKIEIKSMDIVRTLSRLG
jgi:CRP-like cAMP-binding protein